MKPGGESVNVCQLDIESAVRSVSDPELAGVSIGDLGLVRSIEITGAGSVSIMLVPTFLGCPALDVITRDVEAAARSAGATQVTVRFDHSVPWTTDQVSTTGRQALASFGIAVASGDDCLCPYCDSSTLRELSPVGPAACRSSFWCDTCRNIVEVFRDARPRSVSLPVSIPIRRAQTSQGTPYAHV
jgi:ring-1,2-phenylacetyl-CoA epoxidase subunit PaaD